jgi:hypothetical protein
VVWQAQGDIVNCCGSRFQVISDLGPGGRGAAVVSRVCCRCDIAALSGISVLPSAYTYSVALDVGECPPRPGRGVAPHYLARPLDHVPIHDV